MVTVCGERISKTSVESIFRFHGLEIRGQQSGCESDEIWAQTSCVPTHGFWPTDFGFLLNPQSGAAQYPRAATASTATATAAAAVQVLLSCFTLSYRAHTPATAKSPHPTRDGARFERRQKKTINDTWCARVSC